MDNDAYKKALFRERTARESAEKILEEKSLELFNINKNLESLVEARTGHFSLCFVQLCERCAKHANCDVSRPCTKPCKKQTKCDK